MRISNFASCGLRLLLLLTFQLYQHADAVKREEFLAKICGNILCSFQHMEFDMKNNKLYIGAVNKIYQLSEDLDLEKTAFTGPKKDSEKCYPHSTCPYQMDETNNLNKLLILDSDNDRLIACGSIKQGICELRQLGNVTRLMNDFSDKSDPRTNDFVASTSTDHKTVAFIAKEGENNREISLYVGASRTAQDSELISDDEQFPTFASRRLLTNNMDSSMLDTKDSSLTKQELATHGFRVNFVSAFNGDQNGYFVLTYPEISDGDVNTNKVNSYIAQVCMRGSAGKSITNSYFEIPIAANTLISGRQTSLTRVIASTTAEVGQALKSALGIEIGSGNPDVLFASFATEGDNAGGSALAMFPLYMLNNMYYEMAKKCLRGGKMHYVKWQRDGGIPCNDISFSIDPPVCSDYNLWDIVGLLQRNSTFYGYTVYESHNTTLTSVAVAKQGRHTVVFMGTDDGRLLKLKVDSKPSANRLPKPYDEVVIDSDSSVYNINWKNMGSPSILPDMRLDKQLSRLFVMSERKLVSLPLYDCSRYMSCFDCLNAGDPFCGWCTLENKCTPAHECPKGENYYATSIPSNCPKLKNATPAALHLSSDAEMLTIAISNIPRVQTGGHYKCVFEDQEKEIEKDATYKDTFIKCMSPSPSELQREKAKEVKLPLSLYYIEDAPAKKTKIASTEILFYDCKYLDSCLSCLHSTDYNCHWCVGDNMCVKKSKSCKTHPGDIYNDKVCPQLSQVKEPLYIHDKKRKRVGLTVKNLDKIVGTNKFFCKFTIPGLKPQMVNASHTREAVTCGPVQGFLPTDKYEADAQVDLYWGQNYLIDNPKSLSVKMYRCSRGEGDSCGKCLLLDSVLHCGWCEAQEKCMLCDDCTGRQCRHVSGVYNGWLDEAQVCMHPEILDFSPKSASPGGLTTVTIHGKNFGRIINRGGREAVKVMVAGETCNIQRDNYKESEMIVCKVGNVPSEKSGKLEVCILNFSGDCKGLDYQDYSTEDFNFVTPELTKFTPEGGLAIGGTIITLSGNHLNIGNNVTVQIDDRDCAVVPNSVKNDEIKCKLACQSSLGRSRRHSGHHRHNGHHRHRHLPHLNKTTRKRRFKRETESARVELNFDGYKYYYKEAFKMEKSKPQNLKLDRHESIKSGGMRLEVNEVTGNNLRLVQDLVLEVSLDGHSKSRVCEMSGKKPSSRTCLSPSIKGRPIGVYEASLIFDNCMTEKIGIITYKADPFVNMLEGPSNVLSHQSGPIIINGQNLCPNPSNCDRESAKVSIGDELSCNVSALDEDKLVCLPPKDATGKHIVMVSIGGYSQRVGSIEFESGATELVYVIPIVIVIVLGAIIGCVIIQKRAGKKMKLVKQEQMKYDMMEAKVAKECKEAFAELQTDMQSDLDNMGTVGIPFRQRNDYIMRVLFPDPEMQDKLKSFVPSNPYTPTRFNMHNGRGGNHRMLNAAFDDFDQLLENKTFLITFIHALESQKRFSMKDRGNVAGLLMVVLQNRLEYSTGILEELLSELIRDVIENRGNPKLLLRRSESVAEKMLTHWFSILLHGFLQDCAGEPLFTLYRAIRAQLDKGPVDAITGFAKYSLNQDKLLRQAINYEQLTLYVADTEHPNRELQVRVLDCDTITQTKEKIIALKYRNVPQSQHPSPDAFDLEIKSETLGGVPLNDEDNTSITESGWRRLNTLQHYKVKDKSVVNMVLKNRNQMLNQSLNSNQSGGTRVGGMVYNGSGHRLINDGAASLPRHFTGPQDTRSSTPTQVDDGKRPYHLMKLHDNEPRDGSGTIGNLMVSEIYLTRLLATKGTIQKFVDDLLEAIFSVVQRGHALPLAIKHMFDFFDEQAGYYNIVDRDIVHTWKSNSLPLRFWVNLIKNPEFLFDIKKSELVDSCLSVIAGAFMDSCSTSDQNLGKDSPSGKLLYAKEVQNYKRWVVNYYNEISAMDHLGPQDMQCFLRDESQLQGRNSGISQAALSELYVYVQKYNQEVIDALNGNPQARSQRLAQKLEHLTTTMTSTV